MRIRKVNTTSENQIVMYLITSDEFLGRIVKIYSDTLFRTELAQVVSEWCVEYYREYKVAPKSYIHDIFLEYKETSRNEGLIKLLPTFLEQVEKTLDDAAANLDYMLEYAERHFNQVVLKKHVDYMKDLVDNKHFIKADEERLNFTPVRLTAAEGIDPFNDFTYIENAFAESFEPLIKYPGDFGALFNPLFVRDGFVSFLAPPKSGKSFMLYDVAIRAIEQGRKVALFEVGDMSQNQSLRRLSTRITGLPLMTKKGATYRIPRTLEKLEGIEVSDITHLDIEIEDDEILVDKEIPISVVKSKIDSFWTKYKKDSQFKMVCHPSDTVSVLDIHTQLIEWEAEGFMPDVIIIDYADILRPSTTRLDYRNQINDTWKKLRSLSTERHALVVTATQTNSDGFDSSTQHKGSVSEDKRKLAHVTGMIGINQNDDEKEVGIVRYNSVVVREDHFITAKCVRCTQCLALARPVMQSIF